jgi:hypothetical protein
MAKTTQQYLETVARSKKLRQELKNHTEKGIISWLKSLIRK